ncbi:GAF domain-containing protein [Lentzea sp. NPDC102401]|uniref:GAF domain-containing protein n=1 Tax=Lentzea sp. NPDC102401 TaxID=3364128 RepID=UPI00382AAAE9
MTAALTVPAEQPGWLRIAVAEGGLREWEGRLVPVEGSVSALAIEAGRAVIIDDVVRDERTEQAARSSAVGPTVAAPIIADGEMRGVLMIGRPPGSHRFADCDREMADAVAGYLGWALLARADPQDAGVSDLAAAVHGELAGRLFQLTVDLCSLRSLVPEAAMAKIDKIIASSDALVAPAREALCEKISRSSQVLRARSRVVSAFGAALSTCDLVGSVRIDDSTALEASNTVLDIVERWVPVAVAIAARYGLARAVALDVCQRDGTIEAQLRYRGWAASATDLPPVHRLQTTQEVDTRQEHTSTPADHVVLRLAIPHSPAPQRVSHTSTEQ